MSTSDILAKLISFPVLGGESNSTIASWIESYLQMHGVAFYNVFNEDKTKRCIHCRIGPALDGGVILSGHMDVVPVENQDWDTDPFTLTDKGDGNLYGRGSCDMKGFLACCLAAVPKMIKGDLKKPVYLAFSYDEEVGCLAGDAIAASIKSNYSETPAFAIVGEPSMLKPVTGHKGIVVYKTTVNGSAGHSSGILNEVSAIHESARLILWLENKMKQLIKDGHIDERFTPPHSSLHCGMIEKSGIAHNVIADKATFVWDLRVIPMDKAIDIRADFDRYCNEIQLSCQQRWPEFKIETTEYHPDVPALDTPNNTDIIPFIKELSGSNELSAVSYASEAGQFSNAGFQTVICGPGDIAQAHRANEFISKAQLTDGLKMLMRLIEAMSN